MVTAKIAITPCEERIAINTHAEKLLQFLDEHRITSADDVGKLVGETFSEGSLTDIIEIGESSHGIRNYRISYITKEGGIALEVVFSPQLGYSHVILKTTLRVGEYTPFGRDINNRIRQSRVLTSPDIEILKRELGRLRNY